MVAKISDAALKIGKMGFAGIEALVAVALKPAIYDIFLFTNFFWIVIEEKQVIHIAQISSGF